MNPMTSSSSNPVRVCKFGGSSVANAENWPLIANHVRSLLDEDKQVIVVVSALKGITDLLEAQIRPETRQNAATTLEEVRDRHLGLLRALNLPADLLDIELAALGQWLEDETSLDDPARQAEIIGSGELLSSRLATACLEAQELPAERLDSREVLTSRPNARRSRQAEHLSAECHAEPDPAFQARLAA
jgi:bifunctional diaminopimelate decarboxylase / aspartate kinase